MSIGITDYKDAGGSSRLPSKNLWGQFNEIEQESISFFEDFIEHPTDSATALYGWEVTEADNGQLDPANIKGGGIVLQGDTAENDGIQMQTGEAFYPTAGEKIGFECRMKASDADQVDVLVGLSTIDTTLCAGEANDTINLRIVDEDASIKYRVDKDGAVGADTDSGSDASDDTFVKVGFVVDGTSSVDFYVDGEKVGSQVTSSIPDNEALAVSLAILTGAAATTKLTVDWVKCLQE